MRALNLMASPGSMDLTLMAKPALEFFKKVNPKGYEDCMTIYDDAIEFDNSFVLTPETARTDYGKQVLLRTGIIRPITESGYDGSYYHGRPDLACGFFMMEPGCFPEEERQRLSSRKDNFVEQWTYSYYNNFLFWLDNAPDKPWKITTIFQMLYFNHFPAFTNDIVGKFSNTKSFAYECLAWRSKYYDLFKILLLTDPNETEPALGVDLETAGFDFHWPGFFDRHQALKIVETLGEEDSQLFNKSSISTLFDMDTDFKARRVDNRLSRVLNRTLHDDCSSIIY